MDNRSEIDIELELDLSSVRVRPIFSDENQQWHFLMNQHHYLKTPSHFGEYFKYIALDTETGRWLALLSWGSCALKNRYRDSWIGWLALDHYSRLKYIINNTRFLILPWIQKKNLASKVLSLNLKRISKDWEGIYNHPVLLAETFVDISRYKGTCYKASNWINLGLTRGYSRNGKKYIYHGSKKSIWVIELRRDTRELLTKEFLPSDLEPNRKGSLLDLDQVSTTSFKGLKDRLSQLKDVRKSKGKRHDQAFTVLVAICAVLSGCRGYRSIGHWASKLTPDLIKRMGGKFHYRIGEYVAPSEPTIRRALQRVDVDEVDKIAGKWFQEQSEIEAIAIDGKRLRGASKEKPVHLLAAIVHQTGTVIAQNQVADKTNEIPGFTALLDNIEIKGKVITADAMHTQVNNALYLKKHKSDYVFEVKGNQPNLLKDIENIFTEDDFPPRR